MKADQTVLGWRHACPEGGKGGNGGGGENGGELAGHGRLPGQGFKFGRHGLEQIPAHRVKDNQHHPPHVVAQRMP